MNRIAVCVIVSFVVVGGTGFAQQRAAPSSTLVGAWRVSEETTTAPGGGVNRSPQPALFLFTAKHYSLMRVTSNTPRPTYRSNDTITPQEALASWGPLQAQSGTYEAAAGKLTTRMRDRTVDTYSYTLDGNTLTLKTLTNSTGPIQNPTTFKLVRAE